MLLNRLVLLFLMTLLPWPAECQVPVNERRTSGRPNLIFIFTDQQRADTMKAYGNAKIKTPNLDALAERSFVFESCYVTQPLCSPSRASLLTGLYPHTHGTWENGISLNKNIPILVEMVKDPDYVSGYFGKWHLGSELSKQRGFTEFD